VLIFMPSLLEIGVASRRTQRRLPGDAASRRDFHYFGVTAVERLVARPANMVAPARHNPAIIQTRRERLSSRRTREDAEHAANMLRSAPFESSKEPPMWKSTVVCALALGSLGAQDEVELQLPTDGLKEEAVWIESNATLGEAVVVWKPRARRTSSASKRAILPASRCSACARATARNGRSRVSSSSRARAA
jgi:hypothetical protein